MAAYLVVANGSARRSDTAPGYLDERAVPFDEAVEAALRWPDPDALADVDVGSRPGPALPATRPGSSSWAACCAGSTRSAVDYAADPYGVAYWVVRWEGENAQRST